jgi:hypothetical protein
MSKTHKVHRDVSRNLHEFGDPGAKRALREVKRIARIHRRRIVAKRAREKLRLPRQD